MEYQRWRRRTLPAQSEFSAAAAIHPNSSTVETPSTAALTPAPADLADEDHASAGIGIAVAAAAIIGRTDDIVLLWPRAHRRTIPHAS
jgi:hypothetical protein